MMKILFWVALFGSCYSYFLYPLILLALPKRKGAESATRSLPSLSIIITAHNEAARIAEKLENTLALDYPPERREIIVASDASTDDTDEIVNRYGHWGVRVVRCAERRGKEHAQGVALREARGEIIVFTDVSTRLDPNGVSTIVAPFADPSVGCVSSEDRFLTADGRVAGEGGYVKYEMWLRRLESSVHSLVGLSGSFFAVRRELCQIWDERVPSDFNAALNSARSGYLAVVEPRALGYYRNIKEGRAEYGRKLRTVIRGITALAHGADLLDLRRYGLFAFQIWSHKVMRWLVPWCMVALLVASLALRNEGLIYAAICYAQLTLYGAVAAGVLIPTLRNRAFFRIPFYFVQANVAIAHATLAWLAGRRMTVWEPSRR